MVAHCLGADNIVFLNASDIVVPPLPFGGGEFTFEGMFGRNISLIQVTCLIAWVYARNPAAYNSRVMELTDRSRNHLVSFGLAERTGRFEVTIDNKPTTSERSDITTRTILSARSWVHVAVVLKSGSVRVFFDGKVQARQPAVTPELVTREFGTIGGPGSTRRGEYFDGRLVSRLAD